MIVQDDSSHHSHWNAAQSLSEWLESEGIPGIDTRAITKKIRATAPWPAASSSRAVTRPSAWMSTRPTSPRSCPPRRSSPTARATAQDPGRGLWYQVQHHPRARQARAVEPRHLVRDRLVRGLFISNGPGDPAMMKETTEQLKKGDNVKSICLGNQLLSLAAGANTFKLPFGNRDQNQPVHNLKTTSLLRTTVTRFTKSSSHSLGSVLPSHLKHAGGPTDMEFLFDTFLDAVHIKEKGPIKSLVQRPHIERPKVKKVLVLGSGGLSIGQAGEFDYLGFQAIKALKEEDIETILINQHRLRADEHRPLERVSGQQRTALNCGVELDKRGVFEKYGVKVLGTLIDVINYTEDRELFNDKLPEINESITQSEAVESVEDAVKAAYNIGFPSMIRSAFALGGLGSGICGDEAQLRKMAKQAFSGSSQILVEHSMKGWKEVEYEVVRDAATNCLTVCNMENFDPLDIHTGKSIVIAPSQTLSNRDEVMSIARTFEEAIQKALRMVEPTNKGFDPRYDEMPHDALVKALGKPTDRRISQIAQALKTGHLSIEQVH
ncbi:unnamed protein product [Phytophthora lilii]|uniref:Unnamed protein product n=1 Tax=Phytophthora lilii TaxID=2077276 RepID=A0A9W7D9N1_9STRA|nr:unnamed protein product [Phytophthora lilii]